MDPVTSRSDTVATIAMDAAATAAMATAFSVTVSDSTSFIMVKFSARTPVCVSI